MTKESFITWIDDQIAFWNKAFSQETDDMEKSYINGRLSTFHDLKSQLVHLVLSSNDTTK